MFHLTHLILFEAYFVYIIFIVCAINNRTLTKKVRVRLLVLTHSHFVYNLIKNNFFVTVLSFSLA